MKEQNGLTGEQSRALHYLRGRAIIKTKPLDGFVFCMDLEETPHFIERDFWHRYIDAVLGMFNKVLIITKTADRKNPQVIGDRSKFVSSIEKMGLTKDFDWFSIEDNFKSNFISHLTLLMRFEQREEIEVFDFLETVNGFQMGKKGEPPYQLAQAHKLVLLNQIGFFEDLLNEKRWNKNQIAECTAVILGTTREAIRGEIAALLNHSKQPNKKDPRTNEAKKAIAAFLKYCKFSQEEIEGILPSEKKSEN